MTIIWDKKRGNLIIGWIDYWLKELIKSVQLISITKRHGLDVRLSVKDCTLAWNLWGQSAIYI